MKSIVLQRYANREIRFGWQDLPASRRKATDSARTIADISEAELVAFSVAETIKTPAGHYTLDHAKQTLKKLNLEEGKIHESQKQRALDITSEFRRGRESKRRVKKVQGTPNRCTVFGRNARHTLLEAGSVTQRWAGSVSNCVIITLTLPGSTEEAYATLAAWSGYIGDRLCRRLRNAGTECRWFYVWELQRRGALHMHLCIASQSAEYSLHLGEDIVDTWWSALDDVGSKSGVDLFLHRSGTKCTARRFWQADIQQCKRSVAAYFSKYASKETRSAQKGVNGKAVVHPYHPSRWWGCQRILRGEIEEERLKLTIEGVTENDVASALILIDNWCNQYGSVRGYGYDFELSYIANEQTRQLGYGERFIRYFEDDVFLELSHDLPELMKYLCIANMNATIKCNRMSALHTPVENWCMQSTERERVP